MFRYIVDRHIVNHYENSLPNAILFFLVGGVYSGMAEYRETGSIVKTVKSSISGGTASCMASILFGQPMFIVFVGVSLSLLAKRVLKLN
jgi:hypothetical protein